MGSDGGTGQAGSLQHMAGLERSRGSYTAATLMVESKRLSGDQGETSPQAKKIP